MYGGSAVNKYMHRLSRPDLGLTEADIAAFLNLSDADRRAIENLTNGFGSEMNAIFAVFIFNTFDARQAQSILADLNWAHTGLADLAYRLDRAGTSLGSADQSHRDNVAAQQDMLVNLVMARLGHALGNRWLHGPPGQAPDDVWRVPPPEINYPGNDPTRPPGFGFEWRGNGPPGSGMGNWYHPFTKEKWNPDLNHAPPIGPHWDYTDPSGRRFRVFPDGWIVPK